MLHKRAIFVPVLLILSLILAACGSEATPAPATTTAPAVAATTAASSATTAAATTAAAATTTIPGTSAGTSAATPAATSAAPAAATTAAAAGPRGQTLTIAVASSPAALDPGKGNPVDEPFITPAYD